MSYKLYKICIFVCVRHELCVRYGLRSLLYKTQNKTNPSPNEVCVAKGEHKLSRFSIGVHEDHLKHYCKCTPLAIS